MSSRQHVHQLGLAVACCCLVAACAGGTSAEPASSSAGASSAGASSGGDLVVVATTSILGDVVSQVVGSDGAVEVLMGPGVDPHAFQASAQQAQLVREADLVVANGLGLEESLLDTLEAAEDEGVEVLHVAEELDPLAYADEPGHGHADESDEEHEDHEEHEDEEHEDEEHEDHDHGAFDPHVWLDPVRMADGAELVAAELAEVDDTLDDDEWEARGRTYAEELRQVSDEIETMLADVPDERRRFVTNHDSFAYFADRYDFEVIGTVIPGSSTQADTSAAEFADLAQLIVDQDVPAIFAETTSSDELATALVQEVGRDVEVVQLYSGSLGEEGSEAETYVDLLRFDARAIAAALG